MHIGSKRWNDPVHDDDGTRILVSRFRPRGVAKEKETWHEWHRELSPSEPLHAAYYGKLGVAITWEQYRRKFLEEMEQQTMHIDALALRVQRGERITLLCSNACTDASKCHRTLVIGLVKEAMAHQTRR
jgi:uncharacterized protein YeaO (DUF488 family)